MIDVFLETGEDHRKQTRLVMESFSDAFIAKLKAARTILLKVNLVHFKKPLACTDADSVRGALDAIRYYTGARVYIGDGSYAGTEQAFDALGYRRLVDEYANIELADLNGFGSVPGYTVLSTGEKRPVQVSEIAKLADVKIVLTPMKTDRDVGVALSIKSWGMGSWIVPPRSTTEGVVWARWPWLEQEGAWAHHASVAALYAQNRFDAAIVDGILAMEGDGPLDGTACRFDIVFGGEDPVAVDAVGSTLMGFDPQEIDYLRMLGEDRYGCIDMTKINVPPMVMIQLARQVQRPSNN
jgi:uncharacterized protein (DUF362 family)